MLGRTAIGVTAISAQAGPAAVTDSFEFIVSNFITVSAHEYTLIPAAIVNRQGTDLDFAELAIGDVGAGFGAHGGEGLNPLNIEWNGGWNGVNWGSPFMALVLAPGERFDFTFARINFDPSEALGNPLGTLLHPSLSFRIGSDQAQAPVAISVG